MIFFYLCTSGGVGKVIFPDLLFNMSIFFSPLAEPILGSESLLRERNTGTGSLDFFNTSPLRDLCDGAMDRSALVSESSGC